MKKILISLVLMLSLLGGLPVLNIKAITCSGDRFSVDQIIDQTTLSPLGCFALTDYAGAKALFDQKTKTDGLKNVTITYFGDDPNTVAVETTYSKIIVADRAMAYAQGVVYTNASTMNIYGDPNLTVSYTYMDDRNQLFFYGTILRGAPASVTPANLTAEISVNGAHGFVKLNQIQLIPLIYADNGWNYGIDVSGGVTTIPVKQAYYLVESNEVSTVNGKVTLRQLKLVTNYISKSSNTYTINLAPDWLPNGIYYSPDGIYFYTDVDLKNPVYNGTSIGKFYNYYSFTNLRSKTNYTGPELDRYLVEMSGRNPSLSTMTNAGNNFISAQNTYGMNALMIYSMAAQESGFGTSTYAQNPANLNGLIVKDPVSLALLPYTVAQYCLAYPSLKYADENNVIHHCNGRYNLFGWGAYDSNPDNANAYPSIEACINQHMGTNLRRSYMNYDSYIFYGSDIGNKGAGFNTKYASDPWWSIGISAIAYQIDRYLGFKDLNSLQLGILNPVVSNYVYKNTALTQLFYPIPSRASNYSLIILEGLMVNGNLVYKVQTTNPINPDGTINMNPDPVLVAYDYAGSVGYVDADQIGTYVSKFVTGVTHNGLYNTDKQIYFTNGTAALDGVSISSGTSVTTEGPHTVIATSDTGIVQTLTFTIDKTPPVISFNPYLTTPTNQNITVSVSLSDGQPVDSAGQPVANTWTFTENGSHTFYAKDLAGNISEKTVEITNIDKVPPVITIADFDSTTIISTDLIVSASTNEGSLNQTSYTFTHNSSFDFVATDLAGNITTKTVTISNIIKSVIVSYPSTLTGGSLSASINATPLVSGSAVSSTDQVVFSVVLLPKYHVYKWLFNDTFTKTRAATLNLEFPYLDTNVSVELYMEGDMNSDQTMSTTDLVQLRRYLAGLDASNEKAVLAADITGDGQVTTTDLVRIRRMLAGLE